MVTQTFSNLVSKYTENDPMLQFDINEVITTLLYFQGGSGRLTRILLKCSQLVLAIV